ncbi:hydroxyproline-rich glycoprotein family protein [Raphanus sativus]|uniref:Cleavage stimulating factor 64 n=1 Tax=Raphanus sativus TaxID=3726 RepID=A0A6J0KYY6_RAPSA|nr:cleavage stimulating factor 64 [Raphanus sativus]KAJ4875061.1 hydroxyproline-rich glycoprotein family protein [Raphanus sativus]
MAGKQMGGDGVLPANLAGMTKSQLYGIMSQMKALIDQNHEQAREILIQNPVLTKALFQAQIMLGMVQPPQVVVPKVEPQVAPQPPKPSAQAHTSSLQEAAAQPQAPIRKHTLQQPMPMPPPPPPPPPPSVSATNSAPLQQPRFSHPQRLNPAGTSLSHPQSSQVQNAPPPAPHHHPTSQPQSFHHLDTPASSAQLQQPQQQPMHSVGGPRLPQHQPRPYHHQFGPSQTGPPNAGFQHHGAPPQHQSQPMFHSGNRLPASGGPQFPQGQPHLVSQPPYQGGGQFRGDYNNNQLGGPTAADRGPSWMAGQSESSSITHLPGLGPVPSPSQDGPRGGPPPPPAPISAEMEKALLQQVMSLTPEQINLLPPEQRNQVLQLQQILRQ